MIAQNAQRKAGNVAESKDSGCALQSVYFFLKFLKQGNELFCNVKAAYVIYKRYEYRRNDTKFVQAVLDFFNALSARKWKFFKPVYEKRIPFYFCRVRFLNVLDIKRRNFRETFRVSKNIVKRFICLRSLVSVKLIETV